MKRIGIIGAGTIGRAIFKTIVDGGLAEVDYVLGAEGEKPPEGEKELEARFTTDVQRALAASTNMVVEAAHPDVIARYGAELLARGDLCVFSCSALADETTESRLRDAAAVAGSRLFIPHGAILALDGLSDGRDAIDEVVVTTTKSGGSLGVDPGSSGELFDGSAREACRRFPRNVNVHAAVAIAGIGFDRTRSVVIADPDTKEMSHRIQVSGRGFQWEIAVRSTALGGVSGAYTPKSAIGSIQRILGLSPILTC